MTQPAKDGQESTKPPGENSSSRGKTSPARLRHDDARLDEALKETFPASDPPAITSDRRSRK